MAISSLKIKNFASLDKVENYIIQQSPDSVKLDLLNIYNSLITLGGFPSSWNDFLVMFISKSSPGKFRPISFLASCMLELMEKLIHFRLNFVSKVLIFCLIHSLLSEGDCLVRIT